MRKVILNLAVSLDGYIEGPNGEFDWCFTDQDYGMENFFNDIDAMFMGRKSYELIASAGDLDAFPQMAKYIFSDSLKQITLAGASIITSQDLTASVQAVKDQEGKSIWLFGGGELISSFISHQLIDLFILSVHPVLLGGGRPLFPKTESRMDLLHTNTTTYPGGLVQLSYIPRPYFDLNTFLG
jgi:dihydrofolate reductase